MTTRHWQTTDLETEGSDQGIIVRQAGSTYLARNWGLTDQVEHFVSSCVDAGLGCFIRHSHPKVSNRGNGVHYLCASRSVDERWVVGIDQFSPKARQPGDKIQRLIVESHYRLALDQAGLPWDWQSSSAKNIHVPFDQLGRLLTAVAPWVEDIEKGLGTRRWEQVKAHIGFVTEAVLESWMIDAWHTLPFAHEIELVGNQIRRVDIVGRVRHSGETVLFELKRVPADLGTLAQLSRYVAKQHERERGGRSSLWGAIVAPAFSREIVEATAAADYPLALWRYVEQGGVLGLVPEATSWPARALRTAGSP